MHSRRTRWLLLVAIWGQLCEVMCSKVHLFALRHSRNPEPILDTNSNQFNRSYYIHERSSLQDWLKNFWYISRASLERGFNLRNDFWESRWLGRCTYAIQLQHDHSECHSNWRLSYNWVLRWLPADAGGWRHDPLRFRGLNDWSLVRSADFRRIWLNQVHHNQRFMRYWSRLSKVSKDQHNCFWG